MEGVTTGIRGTSALLSDEGALMIPAEFLSALGVNPGEKVRMVLKDGELQVFSIRRGIERAQEIVRRYIPEDRSLVDELIAERRAEAERE